MKLYNGETVGITFSVEDFINYYNSASVVSEEALSDYLYKIKDTFNNLYLKLTGKIDDKAVMDILSNRFEILHRLKRVKFVEIKDILVSKPENFKGKYVDYTLDLINSSKAITEDTEKTLHNLKLAIASFINEYKEDKVFTVYGATYFKNTNKLIESHQKEISKYFPVANGSTKAYLGDVLKTLNDFEALYKNIEVLDKTINPTTLNFISKLTEECAQLVDSLINHNTKTNVLARNDHVKKELINAIHIAAREVEFTNYLYANTLIFYGCFKNITDEVIKFTD